MIGDFFAFFGKLLDTFMAKIYPMASTDFSETTITLVPPVSPQEPPSATLLSNTPPSSSSSPGANKRVSLVDFCTYIRDYEGKPGSLNYQLNNPGDCRPSPVGYLPKYEPVEIIDTDTDPRYPYHKGKFAKFPTYEIGWEYLLNLIHFLAVSHPTWTIVDLMSHYAPSSDGNAPNAYANNLAERSGVIPTTQLKDLFS